MKTTFLILRAGFVFNCALVTANATLVLTGNPYIQDFNDIGNGVPVDWTLRTGGTATSLGSSGGTYVAAPTSWGDGGGAFKNLASAGSGLLSTASTANQAAAPNRALGIRQSGGIGDPGAAFVLQVNNTIGFNNFSLSIDLQMLSVQTRSTVWSVQYGLGATPTSFVTLGSTYSDPGVFGSTTFTANAADLSGINNQSQQVWFRVVALSASTGSGSRDTFGIDNFSLGYSAIAVPEPSTYLAALLLALPFGVHGIRYFRNQKRA